MATQLEWSGSEISYTWDRLIEIFCRRYQIGRVEFGGELTEIEMVTRTMASNRFNRAVSIFT